MSARTEQVRATHWPARPGPVLDWLIEEGRLLDSGAELVDGVCRRLLVAGVPLYRVNFHTRTLHPRIVGASYRWYRDAAEVDVFHPTHDVIRSEVYINSPMRLIYDEGIWLRQRLDTDDRAYDFPFFDELRAEGVTDYVGMPLSFSGGGRHVTSWTTDREGGFTTDDLQQIGDLLPVIGVVLEAQGTRRIARNLLDTYVGHHTGMRILKGEVERGSGETIYAAIWACDLRDFTAMSERVPRDELIGCLNAWFDAMGGAVRDGGGEILKFTGDGLLAIFPMDEPEACERALQAARAATRAMAALNARRVSERKDRLDYGLALHVGDVMYGNIGTEDRLDFTVIGPAVNLAARLEKLCRELHRHVLLSGDFAGFCTCTCPSIGRHEIRGLGRTIEGFTMPDEGPGGLLPVSHRRSATTSFPDARARTSAPSSSWPWRGTTSAASSMPAPMSASTRLGYARRAMPVTSSPSSRSAGSTPR
jgi:adenylate cyclase